MKDIFNEKLEKRYLNTGYWLFGIGIVFVLICPYLFTNANIKTGIDFTQTGQIGYTIGGISAPIVSLIGSGLVFLTLLIQIEANRKQFNLIIQERTDKKQVEDARIQELKKLLQNKILELHKTTNELLTELDRLLSELTQSTFKEENYSDFSGFKKLGFNSKLINKYSLEDLNKIFLFDLSAIELIYEIIEILDEIGDNPVNSIFTKVVNERHLKSASNFELEKQKNIKHRLACSYLYNKTISLQYLLISLNKKF